MTEFLPNGSLYVFLGVAGVLFAMMISCSGFYLGREYLKRQKLKRPDQKAELSFKRRSRKSNFLKKRGERADKDEEIGAIESNADKMRAEIDAKYNNQAIWTTMASGGDEE